MRNLSGMACLTTAMLLAQFCQAEPQKPNHDESQVPAYTLPDPLVMADGQRVADAATWFEKRRPEILQLFETQMYGRAPTASLSKNYSVVETNKQALGGLATRKQILIPLGEGKDAPRIELLMYLPNGRQPPAGVFLGLNFDGNHTVHADPAIKLPTSWVANNEKLGTTGNRASEKSRGSSSARWPIEAILKRGYAVATAYYGDIDPDYHDGFANGVHPQFYKPGQAKPAADEWGAIAAWAWGLSRALDYLETDTDVDANRVAVLGHSRLGKTALWAGATDPRFAIVISNNSGCGGAALSKRFFGETVATINKNFPHWFCENFRKYDDREQDLPFDQHMLIALIAPRPVYVASASEDHWADPRGEFLAAKNAEPVYKLLGKAGLPLEEFPQPDHGAAGAIGYHLRKGPHDILEYDWQKFMDFADKHLEK